MDVRRWRVAPDNGRLYVTKQALAKFIAQRFLSHTAAITRHDGALKTVRRTLFSRRGLELWRLHRICKMRKAQ